jgi:flavin reductase
VQITSMNFREAMARLGAAVNIITTDGPAGRTGFTASAVCSVSDNPPTLLVCMNRRSAQMSAFATNRVLCVNTLSPQHQELARTFAGQAGLDMEDRFLAAAWHVLATGAPVLDEAVVAFDCRITDITEVGTHNVFLCAVEGTRLGSIEEGLIYFGRTYHRIGTAIASHG